MQGTYVGTPCLRKRTPHVREFVERAVTHLRPHVGRFDTIVVQGITGMLVGPWLAAELGVNLAVVRKDSDEHSHDPWSHVEGNVGNRYLFVDDHISYGRTLTHVRQRIAESAPWASQVGTYMYDDPFGFASPYSVPGTDNAILSWDDADTTIRITNDIGESMMQMGMLYHAFTP